MSALYIDCPFPLDPDEVVDADGQKHMGCMFFRILKSWFAYRVPEVQAWIVHFAGLAHSIMDTAFGAKPPAYSVIGSLDRKIRDSPIPPSCRPILDDAEYLEGSIPFEVNVQRWLFLSRQETSMPDRPLYTSFWNLINCSAFAFAQSLLCSGGTRATD